MEIVNTGTTTTLVTNAQVKQLKIYFFIIKKLKVRKVSQKGKKILVFSFKLITILKISKLLI